MPNDLILVQFIHDIRNTGRGRKEQKISTAAQPYLCFLRL